MLRWVNKLTFLDDGALAAKHPHVHAIIHDVAKEYGFTAPSVGIIPTAIRPPSPTVCCARTPASC